MKAKKVWNKLWFLIWKDESMKGWFFSLIILFIFIKFIFFPTLSLAAGTKLPLAIVESCSMYHSGNFFSNYDEWWKDRSQKYNEFKIDKQEFEEFIFNDGFNKGDILFIIGAKPEKLEIGDVIIFNANQQNPVIHRIVKIREQDDEKIFSTIGDNNNGQISFEKNIRQDQLVGKAVFRLAPYIGWGKLIFFEFQKPSGQKGFC